MQSLNQQWPSSSNSLSRNTYNSNSQQSQQQPKIGSYRGLIKNEIQLVKDDEGQIAYSNAVVTQPLFSKLSSVMLRIEDYYLIRTKQISKDHGSQLKVALNNSDISDITLNNEVNKPMFQLNSEDLVNRQGQYNQSNNQSNTNQNIGVQNNFNNNNHINQSNQPNQVNQINLFQDRILQNNYNVLNQQNNQQDQSHNQQQYFSSNNNKQYPNVSFRNENFNPTQATQDKTPWNQQMRNTLNPQYQQNQNNQLQDLSKQPSNQGIPQQVANQEQTKVNDQNFQLQSKLLINNAPQQIQSISVNQSKSPTLQINNNSQILQVQNNQNQQFQQQIHDNDIQLQPEYSSNQQQQSQLLKNLTNQFNHEEFQLHMKNPESISNLINCLEMMKTPSDKKNEYNNIQEQQFDEVSEYPDYTQMRPEYNPYKKLNHPVHRVQSNRIRPIKSQINHNTTLQSSHLLINSRTCNSQITKNQFGQLDASSSKIGLINESRIRNLSNMANQKEKDSNSRLSQYQIPLVPTHSTQSFNEHKNMQTLILKIQIACSGQFLNQEVMNEFHCSSSIDDIVIFKLNELKLNGTIAESNFFLYLEHSIIFHDGQQIQKNSMIQQISKQPEVIMTLLVANQDFHPIFNVDYNYSPAREQLQRMNISQLQQVKNLEVSNQYGYLQFSGLTDLTYVDFQSSITISEGSVMVYDEQILPLIMYPAENNKLNKQCLVNLKIPDNILKKFQIYLNLQYDHRSIQEYLKQIMLQKNITFKKYDEAHHRYSFMIPNFNLNL